MPNDLQQQIDELKAQLDAAEHWQSGLLLVLNQILPLLLRDHPNAEAIQRMLQKHDDRYEELKAHPESAEAGEASELYEPCKMLNRQLAWLGVWPNIDRAEFVRQSIQQFDR
jgi:hypothetical protein